MHQSEKTTQGIRISVQSAYCPEQSEPDNDQWLFLYTVKIVNESPVTVQLINRHWIITDGNGETKEVIGNGVVGEQPVLEPGASFEYTSACPLKTQVGSMYGSYMMVTTENEHFDAQIAPFTLSQPSVIH